MKNKVIPVRYGPETGYQITVSDSFEGLPDALAVLDLSSRKVCVITDSHVEKLYADEVTRRLASVCSAVHLFSFPAGEAQKNLHVIQQMYRFFVDKKLDRKDVVISLGGGVVGDMAGFAAATYMRGIRFVQVPTTLLAQVDSSIGGKTGVDFGGYKNLVGAFHMPSAVYINVSVLATLPDEQFSCGMGEVLKHGLIRDAAYYAWTIENMSEIMERDMAVLPTLVETSCLIKKRIVENDPKEQGERALLNFGHTVGHAIETLKGFSLPHGHCVALGCVAAAYISWQRGHLSEEEFYEARDMNVGFSLPITYEGIRPEDIVETLRHDKKMDAGKIRFILLKKIGKAFIDTTVTEEEILEAVRQIDGSRWG